MNINTEYATTATATDSNRSNSNRSGAPQRAKRCGSLLLAGALAAGLPAVVAPPVNAKAVTECSSRDWSCDKSGYAKHAHRSFWLMYAGHNCTNYVAYRLIRDGASPKLDYLHNGGDWARDARGRGIPVNGNPAVGAAAQWNPGAGGMSSSGHVAFVEEVGDGWIVIAEDNYSSGPMNIRRIHIGDPEWPSNFIHFPRRSRGVDPAVAIPDPGRAADTNSAFDLPALFRAAAPRLVETV